MVASNNNFFVRRNGDKVVFDLDAPSGIAAMDYVYKMAWEDKCLGVTGVFDSWTGGEDEFKAGRLALYAGDRGDMSFAKDMDDKIGMIPFPIGPNGGGKYIGDYPAFDFWGIAGKGGGAHHRSEHPRRPSNCEIGLRVAGGYAGKSGNDSNHAGFQGQYLLLRLSGFYR